MLYSEFPAVPEWVSTDSLVNSGLDLTGLRLPVLTIGTQLLDGITTVTPSVRYISLLAWIVSSYIHAKQPNSRDQLQEFAARVEAAVAVANLIQNPNQSGVVGAIAAGKIVRDKSEEVDLKRLVEQLASTIYLNPAIQLGFLLAKPSVPGLSVERGEALAVCVRGAAAGTELGKRFGAGEIIERATRVDVRSFASAVDLSGASTAELEILISGIIPLDPRSVQEGNRVSTYTALLGLANELKRCPSEDDFFREASAFKRVSPTVLHRHLDSWLRHLVRDSLAVGHEFVLQETLHALSDRSHGTRMVHRAVVVRSLCDDVQSNETVLRELKLLERSEGIAALKFEEVFTRIKSIVTAGQVVEGGLRRWDATLSELLLIKMVEADSTKAPVLLPVIWSVAALRAEVWEESETTPFEGRAGLGWDLIGVCEVLIPEIRRFIQEDWSVSEVMEELTLRTVEQHLRVSWSRMATDARHDVALLVADGDEWQSRSEKHVQDFSAGRTNSRIGLAVSWLTQLRLIDSDGLTPTGQTLYAKLCAQELEIA